MWSFLPGRRRAHPLGFALSRLHSRRLHRCLPSSVFRAISPHFLIDCARTGTRCLRSCMCGRSGSQPLRHRRARLWFAGPLLCHEWRTTLSGTYPVTRKNCPLHLLSIPAINTDLKKAGLVLWSDQVVDVILLHDCDKGGTECVWKWLALWSEITRKLYISYIKNRCLPVRGQPYDVPSVVWAQW